ncbi:MAG: hypothetical protein Q8M09_17980 [Pseudomonadota bacterium]|nr:hypothetical protein [Pseudomonadota bacterium]MDP1906107.1 hypothetical protein [Pseudomonadota bacterium]MDP2353183.1 hypothetical protein [Pseudomonadota bacterium]
MTVIPAQAGIQFVGLTALKINQIYNLDSLSPLRKRGCAGMTVGFSTGLN